MEQRVQPHSLEAEQGLLGALLTDTEVVHEVVGRVGPDDFYREAHQEVFRAIVALYERNEPADLLTVTEELTRKGAIDRIGGAAYLGKLTCAVPSSAHATAYRDIVHDHATRRRLIAASQGILEGAYATGEPARETVDRAEQAIFDVAGDRVAARATPVAELLKETMEVVERYQARKGAVTGLATGFHDLDDLTDGLQPSELIIIAARPSVGKTSFALNIAYHAAVQQGKGVAVFSLETSKQQVTQNLLCLAARLDAHHLRRGRLSPADWDELVRHADPLSRAPLFIDDTAQLSAMDVRSAARRLARRGNLGLVVIDYLQLMHAGLPGHQSSREQEVSYLSRSLKAMARELRIPVVALSQLNRAVENRPDNRPRMSDLRESGAIEQDADVVMLLHREGYYKQERDDTKTEVIVAKQRHGPTDTVKLAFLKRFLRFEAWSAEHEPGEVPAAEMDAQF